MDTAILTSPDIATAADRLAGENFRVNLAALGPVQPGLAHRIGVTPPSVQWIFARDGYLSARTAAGWWTGCSVPLRAAREMLKKLELIGSVGCFLNPTHAAQIRACFEKLGAAQALIAVVPDLDSLGMILHCEDFSSEIAAARLHFVSGDDWADQLADLFARHPGLPLPQQFVRTVLLDDAEMAPFSCEAQAIISRETSRRTERLAEVFAGADKRSPSGHVIVLAGSRFNLGDLSSVALRCALLGENSIPSPGNPGEGHGEGSFAISMAQDPHPCPLPEYRERGEAGVAPNFSWSPLDPDHPLTASPLALAEAAAQANALVAADLFRSDLPGIVPRQTAWITWLTNGRIVAPDPQGPADALLLADPQWRQAALDAGWPAERVQIAGWPRIVPPPKAPHSPGFVGLLSDVCAIEIPQRVKDFSSQMLLWEMIEEELSNRPWSLGDNPQRYLQARMKRFNIADEGFDRALFFERLIAPAYKMGLARFLMRGGIRLAAFGRGWKEIPEFGPVARGSVANLGNLVDAISECDALLEPFPGCHATVEPLPLPVVRPMSFSADALKGEIHRMLNSNSPSASAGLNPLSREIIQSLRR